SPNNIAICIGTTVFHPEVGERKDGALWMPVHLSTRLQESISRDGRVTWSKSTETSIKSPDSRFRIL
ncbi:MAG: hypothetical protein QGG53_21605, partial [Planctomycetota bacterium]|nr:hypothetical protein [Planctomycetota bacterium]